MFAALNDGARLHLLDHEKLLSFSLATLPGQTSTSRVLHKMHDNSHAIEHNAFGKYGVPTASRRRLGLKFLPFVPSHPPSHPYQPSSTPSPPLLPLMQDLFHTFSCQPYRLSSTPSRITARLLFWFSFSLSLLERKFSNGRISRGYSRGECLKVRCKFVNMVLEFTGCTIQEPAFKQILWDEERTIENLSAQEIGLGAGRYSLKQISQGKFVWKNGKRMSMRVHSSNGSRRRAKHYSGPYCVRLVNSSPPPMGKADCRMRRDRILQHCRPEPLVVTA